MAAKKVLRSTLLKARSQHRRELLERARQYDRLLRSERERWLREVNDKQVREPKVSDVKRDEMNEATLARLRMILANILRDWSDRIPETLVREIEGAVYRGEYRRPLPVSTLRE
jgi:hypothetical protein